HAILPANDNSLQHGRSSLPAQAGNPVADALGDFTWTPRWGCTRTMRNEVRKIVATVDPRILQRVKMRPGVAKTSHGRVIAAVTPRHPPNPARVAQNDVAPHGASGCAGGWGDGVGPSPSQVREYLTSSGAGRNWCRPHPTMNARGPRLQGRVDTPS